MSSESLDEPMLRPDGSRPLTQNGQMVAIGVYGFLVLVGFFFGIVTGYDRPKPQSVAKVQKEKEKEQPVRAETPRPTPPKVTPTPVEPKEEPKPVVKKEPEPEMKKEPEPKKVEPKKVEPKKEVVSAVSFAEVLPVLKKHCIECHGAGKPQGGVDTTTIAKMMASKGKVLAPGKPDESDLYTSITEREMPKDRKKPSDAELLLIRNWILSGAKE